MPVAKEGTPAFDPLDPPSIEEGDEQWEGVYLNRFLSSTFTPGSVMKTVTMTAAIENLPDLYDRTWECTGSVDVGGSPVTCMCLPSLRSSSARIS